MTRTAQIPSCWTISIIESRLGKCATVLCGGICGRDVVFIVPAASLSQGSVPAASWRRAL